MSVCGLERASGYESVMRVHCEGVMRMFRGQMVVVVVRWEVFTFTYDYSCERVDCLQLNVIRTRRSAICFSTFKNRTAHIGCITYEVPEPAILVFLINFNITIVLTVPSILTSIGCHPIYVTSLPLCFHGSASKCTKSKTSKEKAQRKRKIDTTR